MIKDVSNKINTMQNGIVKEMTNVNSQIEELSKKNIRKVFETPSNYFDIEIGKKMIISEN